MKLRITLESEDGIVTEQSLPYVTSWPDAITSLVGVLRAGGFIIPYEFEEAFENLNYGPPPCPVCAAKDSEDDAAT